MNEKRTDIPDEQFQKWLAYERADINDFFDPLFKGLNYLFVAHGAGLFGAITLIKDGKEAPYLQGIAIFFHLFSFGLIFAMISFMLLIGARLGLFVRAAGKYEKSTPHVMMKTKPATTAFIGFRIRFYILCNIDTSVI
jgi:hypothetical protein